MQGTRIVRGGIHVRRCTVTPEQLQPFCANAMLHSREWFVVAQYRIQPSRLPAICYLMLTPEVLGVPSDYADSDNYVSQCAHRDNFRIETLEAFAPRGYKVRGQSWLHLTSCIDKKTGRLQLLDIPESELPRLLQLLSKLFLHRPPIPPTNPHPLPVSTALSCCPAAFARSWGSRKSITCTRHSQCFLCTFCT